MNSRNNLEKLGISPSSGGEEIALEETKHVLSYTNPIELVDLPSEGKYYPEGHPLCGVKSIEIRYMTTAEEEILTSKTLLQKGVALNKMLQNLIVDKNIKVEDMFIGDRNAVAVMARITAHGSEYEALIPCPACGEKSRKVFDLHEATKFKPLREDVIVTNKTFDLVLPSKNTVTVKLLNGFDEKRLNDKNEENKKRKLPETPLKDQLMAMIVAVNGESNGHVIEAFVNSMFVRDSSFLRSEYSKIVPDVQRTFQLECPHCFAESEILMPFTAEFFWPK